VDSLNAQYAIERYQEQYPAFQDAREYKLIKVSFHIWFSLYYLMSVLFILYHLTIYIYIYIMYL